MKWMFDVQIAKYLYERIAFFDDWSRFWFRFNQKTVSQRWNEKFREFENSCNNLIFKSKQFDNIFESWYDFYWKLMH